jgi:hypothetical protein
LSKNESTLNIKTKGGFHNIHREESEEARDQLVEIASKNNLSPKSLAKMSNGQPSQLKTYNNEDLPIDPESSLSFQKSQDSDQK